MAKKQVKKPKTRYKVRIKGLTEYISQSSVCDTMAYSQKQAVSQVVYRACASDKFWTVNDDFTRIPVDMKHFKILVDFYFWRRRDLVMVIDKGTPRKRKAKPVQALMF